MTFVDPISDMIARIRNAQMRLLRNVTIPNSKFRIRIFRSFKNKKDTFLTINSYQILITKIVYLLI